MLCPKPTCEYNEVRKCGVNFCSRNPCVYQGIAPVDQVETAKGQKEDGGDDGGQKLLQSN